MAETETFPIGALLTVFNDRLLCDMDDLMRLVQYVAGRPVMTHQIPGAADYMQAHLAGQHPDLAAIIVPRGLWPDRETTGEAWQAWVLGIATATGGATRAVKALPEPIPDGALPLPFEARA